MRNYKRSEHFLPTSQPRTRTFFGLAAFVLLVAALAPYGATAAGIGLTRLMDGDGSSRAQVDAGKLRVGDGSGPLSVDGTTTGPASRVLLKGNCSNAGNPFLGQTFTIANTPTMRINGIYLGTRVSDSSANAKLLVTAPGDSSAMFGMVITNSADFDERQTQADFGEGLSDPDSGVWTVYCGPHATTVGFGNWIVYGRP